MNRFETFHRILATATRILYSRDPDLNRTRAYCVAQERAELIAFRCINR